jgi:Tol biopolymer transport system component
VAFTWDGLKQDNSDIYVQLIGAGSPLRRDPRADYNPVWSPDGRSIAFLRAERLPPLNSSSVGMSELWLIPPLGGTERKLGQLQIGIVGSPGFLAWCPDSSCLVVTDATGEGQPDALFVLSLESGEKRQLTRSSPPFFGDSNPAIAPDGRALVFRRTPSPSAGGLYWLALGPGVTPIGEPRRLTPATLDAAYPAWMPDGKEILFSTGSPGGGGRGSLWRLVISGDKAPERLPFVGSDGSMPAVSRPQPGKAARLVYFRNVGDANIWRIDAPLRGAPASSPPVVAISSTGFDGVSDLSPDGRRVAFQSNRSGELEIWLADLDGSNAIRLTSMSSTVVSVARWSPDGALIAFQSNREGQFEIYVIPAAGGRPRRITSHPATDVTPRFSRDGQWIYFGSNRTGFMQVWKAPTSGGDAVQVTARGGIQPTEGIDGADLYFVTGLEQTEIWRLPTSGGQPVKLLEGVLSGATFAVVETGIYYIDDHPGQARLQFLDLATGRTTTVARDLGDIVFHLSASADGRTILYSRTDFSIQDLQLVEDFR